MLDNKIFTTNSKLASKCSLEILNAFSRCRVIIGGDDKNISMKSLKTSLLALLVTGVLMVALTAMAGDSVKPKPYPLKTCVVSGEKLNGDMGDPYVFIYKEKGVKDDPGREIKFCCKDCKKDFDKDPAKYVKKLEEAEAKAKK